MTLIKNILLILILGTTLLKTTFSQTTSNNGIRLSQITSGIHLIERLNLELIIKADSGKLEDVRDILGMGINPNATSWEGVTPLMYASLNGHYAIARELIAYGANLNMLTPQEYTALHYATMQNHDSIAELLILNGAYVHPKNNLGLSPLHYASAYGYPFITDLLIRFGANVDDTDIYGNTPLIGAVYTGSLMSTEILLEAWADTNIPDNKGYTPLMVAAQYNDTTMIQLLIDYGADIYIRNSDGITALALAIKHRSKDAIYQILKNSLPPDELHEKRSYAQLAFHYDLTTTHNVLANLGSPIDKKPRIGKAYFSGGIAITRNDFYLQSTLGIGIPNYKFIADLNLGTRPYYKPVKLEGDFETYQFFEKRYLASLSINRNIYTYYKSDGATFSLLVGGVAARSWGKYNYYGAVTSPQTYNLLSPRLAIQYEKNSLHLSVYSYAMNMRTNRNTTITFNLNIGYTLDFRKPKITSKRIEWF